MAQPVWILSVDLQAKTATFQTGLADAAKSARGAFADMKGGAGEMGGAVGSSMGEARHSVMMLGEEFGVHLPRAVSSFIASIGPVGPLMEAAFPFLAIATTAGILLEHFAKLKEAGQKLTDEQTRYSNAAQEAFNSLDTKLLQAQIRTDELAGNHLGALRHQLELIDEQSMEDLLSQFNKLGTMAVAVVEQLQGSWYDLGSATKGQKAALDEFIREYNRMSLTGQNDAAVKMAQGTLEQWQHILEAMHTAQAAQATLAGERAASGSNVITDLAAEAKFNGAIAELKKYGLTITHDEVAAQEQMVQLAKDRATLQQKESSAAGQQKKNVRSETGKTEASDYMKHQEELLNYSRAVDRAMQDDKKETTQFYETQEQELIQMSVSSNLARLAAVNHALQEEETLGRQGTSFYQGLYAERLKLMSEMAKESTARVMASIEDQTKAMDRQMEESVRQHAAMAASKEDQASPTRSFSHASELAELAAELAIKHHYLDEEAQLYREAGLSETQQAQAVARHKAEIDQEYADKKTQMLSKLTQAEQKYTEALASSLTSAIMGQTTWANAMTQLTQQVISSLLQAELKHIEINMMTKQSDAAKAARSAFTHAMDALPFPADVIVAPLVAAGAYAGVMAFAGGTDMVPGVGRGDVVPAMLSPGEGVVPGGVMDGLRQVARNGGFQQGPQTMVHVRPTYHVNVIDGDGMSAALKKHSHQLQEHVERAIRKTNH